MDFPIGDSKRKKDLMEKDKLIFLNIHNELLKKINDLNLKLGNEKFQLLMNSVDKELLKQLSDYKKNSK
jgi:hypothetical protein